MEITEIEGVLNGTTNYILNSMAGGRSYADALKEAQAMGAAEPILPMWKVLTRQPVTHYRQYRVGHEISASKTYDGKA